LDYDLVNLTPMGELVMAKKGGGNPFGGAVEGQEVVDTGAEQQEQQPEQEGLSLPKLAEREAPDMTTAEGIILYLRRELEAMNNMSKSEIIAVLDSVLKS
jgi:hypothetical protein